jgi:acetoin utilization deacetylase AcuC-like enzyme
LEIPLATGSRPRLSRGDVHGYPLAPVGEWAKVRGPTSVPAPRPTLPASGSAEISPHFPGTGAAVERGAGAGRGTTRNVPLPHGTTPAEYRGRYLGVLDSVLASFTPDLVLVSAGFDCLAGDPLGGFHLEPTDLHLLTTDLLDRIAVPAKGRVVAALEGGYVPDRIGSGLVNVLRAFAGMPPRDEERGAA